MTPGLGHRAVSAAAVATWLAVQTSNASASEPPIEDPYAVPPVPRPPTLPELTHSNVEATLESTAGTILPNGNGAPVGAYVQRVAVEVPLGLRRWYVGATFEMAAGHGPVVGSNLVIDGRTLWATRTGLAFGGGLGLIVPTAQFVGDGPASVAALDAGTLRPWDVSFFIPGAIGGRPFIDVRAIDGPFVAQFRQGLDVTTSTVAAGASLSVYATAGLYLGLWATPTVAVGFEAFESYAIDVPGIRDGDRASVVVSPNLRLALPRVEPAISMFTSIGTPLQGANSHIWGFRLAFTLVVPGARD
jgi:hypothetical protein